MSVQGKKWETIKKQTEYHWGGDRKRVDVIYGRQVNATVSVISLL